MSELTKSDRTEWGKFLRSGPGVRGLAWLLENQPKAPVAVSDKLEPHHVQINYGFGLGCTERLKQLKELGVLAKTQSEPETPTLKDTRTLTR